MFKSIISQIIIVQSLISFASPSPIAKRYLPIFFGDIKLRVYSANYSVDDTYVTPHHEEEGVNTGLAIKQGMASYNWTDGILTLNVKGPHVYNGVVGPINSESSLNILQFNSGQASTGFSFDQNGFLQYESSYHWLTCNNIGDPNNYADPAIAFQSGPIPPNCEQAFIVKEPEIRPL